MNSKQGFSFFKLLSNCITEARQTKRDLRRIENLEISIDALQHIVDTVALGNEVEIEIQLKNGGTMTIRRKAGNPGYTSFLDKVHAAKQAREAMNG